MRLKALAIALVLSGCSAVPPPQSSPPPRDYAVRAAALLGQYPKLNTQDAVISELKATQPPQLHDWFACVTLRDGRTYAVFFAKGAATDFREGVAIDRCPEGSAPLPPPPKKPADAKKPGA